MAQCLRSQGLPFDKKSVLSVCRVTQEGSSLQDVLNGAKKLGLTAKAVTADDQGLKALPLPAISYVEHDHFICVVHADKRGVSYLCSDCGPWPGGRVELTWKQWHALDPGVYGVVCKKGSPLDGALSQLAMQKPNTPARVQVAALRPQGLKAELDLLSLLKNHVLLWPIWPVGCGFTPIAQHCPTQVDCPIDHGPPCDQKSGASAGEPVNMATGEEEYTPPADFSVYYPIGPSVTWSRLYNSLRGGQGTYEYDDFGAGWSTNYNVGVYDPGVTTGDPQLRQGATGKINTSGADAPASGLTWDILDSSGTTVATSSVPNSWTVNLASGQFTLTVPAAATVADHYEVRYNTGHPTFSAHFDVIPSSATNPQIQPGGSASFTNTANQAPGTGLTWDIQNSGGTTIASSASPNGWTVSFTVGVPLLTPDASNFKVRYHYVGQVTNNFSALFDVSAYGIGVQPGTKYILFPNGSRVSFTAASIPSASQPTVPCTVQAGVPLLVEWDYDTSDPSGHYRITFPDRSQWVTTTYAKILNGSALVYLLQQQLDRNGNAIYFYYSTSAGGVSGFPLLSSITDSNNSALLTITRGNGTTGNITQIADRYGRSIYYHVGQYNSSNVPSGFPQSQQEVDHVSQIVATGTASPPDRYAYGYQNVLNGEPGTGPPGEAVPFLHTITVLSPTGVGSSTATINYTSGTCYVSSIVDANGNTHTYNSIDGSHTSVTLTDSHSNTLYSYTAGYDGNMSQTTSTNGSGTVTSTKAYSDPNDPYRPSSVKDGNQTAGITTGQISYTWDQYGNCKTRTSARGTITTYTISYANFALGELTQVQEGTKTATSLTYYEPSGLIHTISTPTPGTVGGGTVTTTFTYDNLGNILTEVGPGNNAATTITTTFNYTTDGSYNQAAAIRQPLTKTDNLGHVIHMRYDARANQTTLIDAAGNETDMTFNLADQETSIVFPATGSSGTGRASLVNTYLYPDGPETAETQFNESNVQVWQVTIGYGAEGEMLSRSGSAQPYTQTFDGLYRIKTLSDGNGHVSNYYYTTAGYLGGVTYPGYTGAAWPNLSGADSIKFPSYDDNGNPTQRIDGRGVVTNLVYNDVESKLTDMQYPATPAINVHQHYDSYGRIDSMTDGTGSQSFAYDDRDSKTSNTTTYTGLAAQTISYAFYADGSRQQLTLPDGTSFIYTYDGAQRWTGLSNPSGQTWTWAYQNNNWLSSQNANNTVITTPTRNARGLVTDLANRTGSNSLLSDFGISYSANLTVGSITSNIPAVASFSGTTNYTTDGKVELTQEQSTRSGNYTNAFGYDAAGNPTTFKGVVQNFNSDNQNTASGYVYDGNGNPSTYKGQTLTLDAENRLAAYGSVLTAGYRGDGLRAWKQTSAGRTYFIYDSDKPVLEENASGVKTAVSTFGKTGLLARTTTRTLLYTFDPQGNAAQQIDASNGNIVATYMFDAYGTRAYSSSDTPAINEPYSGFGGQLGYYTDWETGLELLGHRYYDPSAGRFLTRDPIRYAGGINLYEYSGNSPFEKHDPSGFSDEPIGIPPIEGPPEEEGPEAPGLGECIADLMHAIYAAGEGAALSTVACQLASNCMLSYGCGWVLSAIEAAINAATLGMGGGAVLGCIAGAACGFVHSALDYACQINTDPCKKKEPFNFCKAVVRAAAGCLEGAASSIGLGWISSIVLTPIAAAVENWCEEEFPG